MDNPETQATMRTRHDTKTKKNPHHNKINNTVEFQKEYDINMGYRMDMGMS
jgi:hypothetical protein